MKILLAIAGAALLCSLTTGALAADTPTLGPPTDVTFKARFDGSEQHYLEMLPAGFIASEPHSLMIALHGGGSDRHQYATDPRDECKGARDVAAKYSMVYISPDCRGKGAYMGPAAESDMLQIIRDTRKKYKIDRVFLVGASMGAMNALTFTVLHPELVSGVSAQNAHVNYLEHHGESVEQSFGGTPREVFAEYKKRSAEYWPEKFTMPVAITIGGKDPLVAPDSARRFIAVLKDIGKKALLIEKPDGSHITNYEDTVAALEFVIQNAEAK